jgi:hypothetical protein
VVLTFTALAQMIGSPSPEPTGLEYYKDLAQIASYVVGIIVAIVAVGTYLRNSQRDRARWVFELYEKFFEENRYKLVRETLDSRPDSPEVAALLDHRVSEFTDYLNFFS